MLLSVWSILSSALDVQAQTMKEKHRDNNDRHPIKTLSIVDDQSDAPVVQAYVQVDGKNYFSSVDGLVVLRPGGVLQDTLVVSCMGYEDQQVLLDELPSGKRQICVRMVPVDLQLKGTVLTAHVEKEAPNSVAEKLSALTMERSLGTSLAGMLQEVEGVSAISTGTNVSKPVIQGMSGNRIFIVNNGVRQTGQEWGVGHAPELDMNSSSEVQVIKGSDAIRYGSDALGGIVVMDPPPLPYGGGVLGGKASSLFGSNGYRYMLTGQLEGAFPFLRDLAWRVQATYANSGDRSTAHYVLNNTGSRELDFSAALGYNHGPFQVEGMYSRFHNKIGVLFSAQMGSEDLLEERIELGRPIQITPYTRHISNPYQKITHQNATLKARYSFGKAGCLEWKGAWQQDDREEFNNRRLEADMPTVSLHLSSFQNQLHWSWMRDAWKTDVGGQILFIENHSRSGTGFVPVIPNYTQFQSGVYAVAKYQKEKGGLEAGVRFDSEQIRASGFDWTGQAYGGDRHFANVSYSLGGHYALSKHFKLITNLGVAWRAPHVFELYSNGNELASGMFVKGDSLMRSETSYKWITSLEYRQKYVEVKMDGFLQWIKGYIYDEPTRKNITVISGTYPVFQYKQTPAFFRGVDLDLLLKPLSELHYQFVSSYILANEQHTGNYLPFIPSFRLRQELIWNHVFQKEIGLHVHLRHRYVARQKHFDPETDLIPFTPPAYHLFVLHTNLDLPLKQKRSLSFMIAVDNLFNKEYKEYTNRSRYYAHDMGRDIRCSISFQF